MFVFVLVLVYASFITWEWLCAEYALVRKISKKEAKSQLLKRMGKNLGIIKPLWEIPLAVGWNGERFDGELVEKQWKEALSMFQVAYCIDFSFSESFFSYIFKIENCDLKDEKSFCQLLGKRLEKGLIQVLRENNCYISVDSLIFFNLGVDCLKVYVARDEEGRRKILELKEQKRQAERKVQMARKRPEVDIKTREEEQK